MKRAAAASLLLFLVVGQTFALAPTASAIGNPIFGFGTVHGGMYSSVWDSTGDLENMAAWAGRKPTFGGTFHQPLESEGSNWFGNTDWLLENVWDAEATPVANLSINATALSIKNGTWDDEILAWANRVKDWTERTDGPPRQLIIAPLQEHNGTWTPYGCDPTNFKLAYARIRNIVRGVGLDETRVRWMWAPNGWTSTTQGCAGTTLADYYPGASIVDVIGYSAYRWGTENVQSVTGYVADALRTFASDKPFLVVQTAAWNNTSKQQWTRDLFAWAEADPNIVGIVWFNFLKETDWRVWNSSTQTGINTGWKDGMSAAGTDYQWPLTDWFQTGALNFIQYPEMCDRLAGANRYATAAAISADTFAPGVPVAYVATGLGFPDALAAAAAGGALGGPVLLVPGTSVPTETLDELNRLNPDRIVVVGGTSVVSDAVLDQLDGIAPTDRIGGASRYDTAARLALDAFAPGVPIAYVATGVNFPDALAAAAAAGAQGGPVLLTEPNSLPSYTEDALRTLNPDKIVVVGGTGAVSDAVETTLRSIQSNLERIAGSDRYDTAAKLAAFATRPDSVFIATGLGFADALAGAAAAGSQGVPLLLTDRNTVPGPTSTKLAAFSPNPTRCVVLGGTGVITDYVSAQLRLAAG
jgi:putative cell wall-binding protein